MNKSKYFDMAGDIAASKLMPRPEVQVTISMQRGGGLGSLNEKPISSAYGRPIPRTIYRVSGGDIGDDGSFIGGYTDVDAGYPSGPVGDDYGFFEEAAVGPFTYTSPPALQDDPKATPPTTPIQLDIGTGKTGLTQRGVTNAILDIPGMTAAARYLGLMPTVPRTGLLPPSQIEKQRISNQLQDVPFFPSNIPPSGLLPPSQRRTTPVSSGGRGTDPRDFEDDETDDKPITSPAQAFMDDLLKLGGQRYGMKEGYKNSARFLNDSLRTGSVHSVLDAAKKGKWGQAAKGLIVPPELSDIRDREIRLMGNKHGGGLSNLKKSIKINGQPHSLAWINPDEASALKAMGGSGKKVKGIPAYYDESWGGWDVGYDSGMGEGDPAIADVSDTPIGDDSAAYDFGDWGAEQMKADRGPTEGTVTQYAPSDATGADLPDWAWDADEKGIKLVGPGEADSRGDLYFQGEGYDAPGYYRDQNVFDKVVNLFRGRSTTDPLFMARTAKDKQLDIVNLVQTSMIDAVKKTQAQMRSPGRRVAQRGQEKAFDSSEATEKETNEAILEAAKEHMDNVGASFLNVPWFMPGSMLASGANAIGRMMGVIGTGTIGGVSYYIYSDGTINEMPLQGEYEDEGNVVEDKRRRRPIREVASVSETVEEDVAPAKGTVKELLSRRGPVDKKKGLASLQNIFEKSYGRPFKTGLG